MPDDQKINSTLPQTGNDTTFFEKAEACINKYELGSIISTVTTANATTKANISNKAHDIPMTAFIAFAAITIIATTATIFVFIISKKNNRTDNRYGINLKKIESEEKTQNSQRNCVYQQSTFVVEDNDLTQNKNENQEVAEDSKFSRGENKKE